MSRLKELTKYKNTIIERLVGNQNICKAVFYQDRSFLEKPDVAPEQLLYENIYPYNYIPENADNLSVAKTYITISITDYRKAGSIKFKAGNIFINVITHKDLFRTDYGFLRTDYLISEIDDLFEGKRGVGIGTLEFMGAKEITINEQYMGAYLHYRPVDFG
ncbi:hypothetical protein [Paenibacillus naphthalenovorans]|uniref:Uncharacterized protein n=1 Tax=Paenibacillus naphthalenovorans TaxID=162209 RepID=A0A0U2W192_9BACL|nr:hypothetical protein [Paenibacillus naphthalenovorans]ALS22308.1 hypothetical protein IJ22_19340 [Paenibacillus naphthalenovorans]